MPQDYADLILNGEPEKYLKAVTEYKPIDQHFACAVYLAAQAFFKATPIVKKYFHQIYYWFVQLDTLSWYNIAIKGKEGKL